MKRELSLNEMKEVELKILINFHILCEKLGLRYSLGGGTLLGAVRHGGFIPWDDDIDVMMPRPDYDKLVEYCKYNDTLFKLICYEISPEYNNLFAKAADSSTVLEDSSINFKDISIGINIDIFPIDGLGNDYNGAIKQFNRTRFKRELLNAATWKRFFRSKSRPWYYEPIRFAFFVISRFCKPISLQRKIDKVNREVEYESAGYVGCVSGVYRQKEIMEKCVFDQYTTLRFENQEFNVISGYKEYLTKHYGDYMKLPPKEKRVTHHTFKVYLLEE